VKLGQATLIASLALCTPGCITAAAHREMVGPDPPRLRVRELTGTAAITENGAITLYFRVRAENDLIYSYVCPERGSVIPKPTEGETPFPPSDEVITAVDFDPTPENWPLEHVCDIAVRVKSDTVTHRFIFERPPYPQQDEERANQAYRDGKSTFHLIVLFTILLDIAFSPIELGYYLVRAAMRGH
jgi:hypothetical protein